MAKTQTPSPTTDFALSTLCASGAHNDGYIMWGAETLAKDSANLALTRNGVGDWSLNRTAAGAETYNVRGQVSQVRRTGELFNAQLFGVNAPALADKGIKVIDFFALYDIGVVDLTTLTLRLGKTIYNANGVALTQTDIVAATAITKTVANLYRSVVLVNADPTVPVFTVDDFAQLEVELVAVMANTGTLKVRGLGMHVWFNYN
jgi:hypothetical protein